MCPPGHDRMHQLVCGDGQKILKEGFWGSADLPENICQMYHLNGVREGCLRVREIGDGLVEWKGGKEKHISTIYEIEKDSLPRSIREAL